MWYQNNRILGILFIVTAASAFGDGHKGDYVPNAYERLSSLHIPYRLGLIDCYEERKSISYQTSVAVLFSYYVKTRRGDAPRSKLVDESIRRVFKEEMQSFRHEVDLRTILSNQDSRGSEDGDDFVDPRSRNPFKDPLQWFGRTDALFSTAFLVDIEKDEYEDLSKEFVSFLNADDVANAKGNRAWGAHELPDIYERWAMAGLNTMTARFNCAADTAEKSEIVQEIAFQMFAYYWETRHGELRESELLEGFFRGNYEDTLKSFRFDGEFVDERSRDPFRDPLQWLGRDAPAILRDDLRGSITQKEYNDVIDAFYSFLTTSGNDQ